MELNIVLSLIPFLFRICLEYDQFTSANIKSLTSQFHAVGLFLGYGLIQLSFYILAAHLMKRSGATVYNLSILTADFYSLLAGLLLFQYELKALYFIAFFLVLLGITVFSLKPANSSPISTPVPIATGRNENNVEEERGQESINSSNLPI